MQRLITKLIIAAMFIMALILFVGMRHVVPKTDFVIFSIYLYALVFMDYGVSIMLTKKHGKDSYQGRRFEFYFYLLFYGSIAAFLWYIMR